MLIYAAVFAINKYGRFDADTGVFVYGWETGVTNYSTKVFPLTAIEDVRVKIVDWADGPPSFNIAVKVASEGEMEFRTTSRDEAEHLVAKINKMVAKSRK